MIELQNIIFIFDDGKFVGTQFKEEGNFIASFIQEITDKSTTINFIHKKQEYKIENYFKEFDSEISRLGLKIWNKLNLTLNNLGYKLSIPNGTFGENDDFMYVWENTEHYLECEFSIKGNLEFFYANNINERIVWGEDITVNDLLTEKIIEKLKLFSSEIITTL